MKQLKKTKLICTIGPASQSKEVIKELIKNGMDIARLNFSHGTQESHGALISTIREVESSLGANIGIMLDTKGPEVRVQTFANGRQLFNLGDKFTISSQEVIGNKDGFSVNLSSFYDLAKPGQLVKIDDGKFVAKIIKKENNLVYLKATNTHTLTNNKGVNIIGARLDMSFLSQKDISDIKFGIEMKVDFIAASFVRNINDLKLLRDLLSENNGSDIKIISKIESAEALSKIDQIIDASDGIMVARGDLGVEIPVYEVPLVQLSLLEKCRAKNKPVIVATQMLESMQYSVLPTRAEVSDCAFSVLQGSDALMLSGESASGLYPVESLAMQAKISLTVESYLSSKKVIDSITINKEVSDQQSIARSVILASQLSKVDLIITTDNKATLAKKISQYQPNCPVICFVTSVSLARELSIYYGLYPIVTSYFITKEKALRLVKEKYIEETKLKVILVQIENENCETFSIVDL
jgi:pyruvate kinase